MKKSLLITLTVLLTVLFACNQTGKNEVPDGWTTLSESGYSIDYPETWTVDQSGQIGTSFSILAPADSETDDFNENVNLIIQDLGGNEIDLDMFVEISEEQIPIVISSGIIIDSERSNANGRDFHRILYAGIQGQYTLMFEQFYWIEGSDAYILTFTSKDDQYENYKETAKMVMESFRF